MSVMSLNTVEEERILKLLKDEGSKTIVLVGKPGSGKTWMAKKLSARATRERLFDFILWVFLNRNYDTKAFYNSIARQLFHLSTTKGFEVDHNVDIEEVPEEENLEVLEKKISAALERKKFLLILDDEGNKMKEEEIKALLPVSQKNSCKVLITSVNGDRHKTFETKTVIEVNTLSGNESWSLLKQRTGSKVLNFPGMALTKVFVERSIDLLPAAIVIRAKAISYFSGRVSGMRTLESALDEAFDGENKNFIQLLSSAYDMLPSTILMDCTWRGSHFFRNRGNIHYNELIAYWIMEGYFGHIDRIEKAYEEGHRVLMELIDCRLLKKVDADCIIMERSVEADYILMERSMLSLEDCHRCGFNGISRLGLADLFEDGEWGGLGKIAQAGGMIKTPCSGKKGKLSTLLLDGNRLCSEVLNKFCQSNLELQVLAIFNPTLKSLPRALSEIKELNMLVLRGCDFLVNVDLIQELSNLTVLEISGACSLEKLPHNLFDKMTQLRSLNLSGLLITSLPDSFYKLTELHRLLLKDCSKLMELKPLKRSDKLVVLNLSGAASLVNFPYVTLKGMTKLQTLDLSNTKIQKPPIFGGIQQLTHISLRDCHCVERLPSIESLTSLQVLDISGAKSFAEFQNPSFETNAGLKIIDLSGTKVESLPSNIGNPHHLYLKGCFMLKELTYMKALKDLEALHLSGASSLVKIEDMFFEDLKKLRIFDVSETNIKKLPSLLNLCKLRQLLLSHCSSLKKLPQLNNLKKLEVLDLLGCSALTVIQDTSFDQIDSLPSLSHLTNLRRLLLNKCINLKELPPLGSLTKLEELNLSSVKCFGESGADFLEHMGHLQILDLSETPLKKLPSMSKLKDLKQLFLRGCQLLESLQDLEALTKLEVLDLSGTALTHLPPLNNFTKLRQLVLRDCANLEEFLHLEMCDPSGAKIKVLPYGISELTCLEQLDLPNMMKNQEADEKKINCLEEEPNQYQWHISSLPDMLTDSNRPFISVSSSKIFQHLEKNSTGFKQFHFSVCPVDQQNKKGGIHCYRDELIFRGIFSQARCFSCMIDQERSLEICGFHHFPKGTECAKYLFLFDNAFVKELYDLAANTIKLMKGCWIERSKNMESVFHAEEEDDDVELGKDLEVLWLSNLLNFESIYSENLQHETFQNLKYMYLDCCPKISSVFSSSQKLENLEVLEIKFCDKLEALFDDKSAQCKLPKLHTLHLWELPKLKSIGCVMPSLHTLKVGECSILVNVLSSHQLPKDLEILEMKSCDKLETLIENSSTSADFKWPNLHRLHLLRLPELKSIGGGLPSRQDRFIRECPKLPPSLQLPISEN
ncbi:putative disease resistance protein [Camellia lanceoleosa]|uniref:Disease resistance protein n=1 Tax=Camellia lanceoleosa TaxID=1840588 RepID=A0ACC0FLU9_9ERIC|nr:putative disease resistance protein [Camellia lanceoleosa]